jgi:hypothetical protein
MKSKCKVCGQVMAGHWCRAGKYGVYYSFSGHTFVYAKYPNRTFSDVLMQYFNFDDWIELTEEKITRLLCLR